MIYGNVSSKMCRFCHGISCFVKHKKNMATVWYFHVASGTTGITNRPLEIRICNIV
jgi:hypothetical protein